MKFSGRVNGRSCYYKDMGYDACKWFYTARAEELRNRKIAMQIAFDKDEEPNKNLKKRISDAWSEAYKQVPMQLVPIDQVALIVPDKIERSEQGKRHWTWYTKENHI